MNNNDRAILSLARQAGELALARKTLTQQFEEHCPSPANPMTGDSMMANTELLAAAQALTLHWEREQATIRNNLVLFEAYARGNDVVMAKLSGNLQDDYKRSQEAMQAADRLVYESTYLKSLLQPNNASQPSATKKAFASVADMLLVLVVIAALVTGANVIGTWWPAVTVALIVPLSLWAAYKLHRMQLS